jgi:hypothetical protein
VNIIRDARILSASPRDLTGGTFHLCYARLSLSGRQRVPAIFGKRATNTNKSLKNESVSQKKTTVTAMAAWAALEMV